MLVIYVVFIKKSAFLRVRTKVLPGSEIYEVILKEKNGIYPFIAHVFPYHLFTPIEVTQTAIDNDMKATVVEREEKMTKLIHFRMIAKLLQDLLSPNRF